MFSKEERSTFPYWFAHWAAYQMTALNCRAWKVRYLFHDLEKPWLKLFLPYKTVQQLHRACHRHHPEWLENKLFAYEPELTSEKVQELLRLFDYDGAIIDWECCHYTKSEEPLNAHDEYKRLLAYEDFKKRYPLITKFCYNEFSRNLMDSIKKLGLENNDKI